MAPGSGEDWDGPMIGRRRIRVKKAAKKAAKKAVKKAAKKVA